MDLNLSVAKDILGLTGTTAHDATLTLFLRGVVQAVETYLGYQPWRAARTEYKSTNGERELWLDCWPLNAAADVTAVYEDRGGYYGQPTDAFDATASLLVAGEDYAVRLEGSPSRHRAVLVRIGTVWPFQQRHPIGYLSSLRDTPVSGCVKVNYTAGWSETAPADVISACYAEAAALWASRLTGTGLQTSAGLDGYSISISPFAGSAEMIAGSPFVTERLLRACRAYRKIPLGR